MVKMGSEKYKQIFGLHLILYVLQTFKKSNIIPVSLLQFYI